MNRQDEQKKKKRKSKSCDRSEILLFIFFTYLVTKTGRYLCINWPNYEITLTWADVAGWVIILIALIYFISKGEDEQ